MKCPACGHWNKPSFPRCFQCGEPLDQNTRNKPAWQEKLSTPRKENIRVVYDDAEPTVADLDEEEIIPPKTEEPLATEMSKLKERRARGEKYLEDFRKNASEQGIAPSGSGVRIQRQSGFFTEVPDDPDQTVYSPPEMRQRLHRKKEDMESLDDDPFEPLPEDMERTLYDDIPSTLEAPPTLPPMRKRMKRKRRRHSPITVAIWCVSVVAACAVCFFGWQGILYLQSASSSTAGGEEAIVTMETMEVNGYPGRRIRISGKEGAKMYIAELFRSFVVVDGFAEVDVADYEFYEKNEEHLEAETMEVRMTPVMVEEGGRETRLKPITFTIDIPLSKARPIKPDAFEISVNSSIEILELEVEPNSTVMVNGQNASDTIDESGKLAASVPIQAIGENRVVVTVRAPHCRENNLTYIFYREPQTIPLQLAPATATETSTWEMTINASTIKGATITIESPTYSIDDSDLLNTESKSANFSFKARMVRVGYNTIRIRASMPGREDTILEHTVTYIPSANEYTRKAWGLTRQDYNELLNNITFRSDNAQVYECIGPITEILSTSPQIAIMDTTQDGNPQQVMLQNSSKTTWEVGKTYRVYADVSGLYDTIPKLVARFTYEPRETDLKQNKE